MPVRSRLSRNGGAGQTCDGGLEQASHRVRGVVDRSAPVALPSPRKVALEQSEVSPQSKLPGLQRHTLRAEVPAYCTATSATLFLRQSRRTTHLATNRIPIVGPDLVEALIQLVVHPQLLLRRDSQMHEMAVDDPARDGGLHDVRTVDVVSERPCTRGETNRSRQSMQLVRTTPACVEKTWSSVAQKQLRSRMS